MERQRKIKILALIAMSVAVLGLTVAFAFISTTLKINGSGTFTGASWDVHFENLSEAKITGTAKEVTKPQIVDGGITINDLNVSVLKPMDKIVYTVDVVNSGKMTAEISSISMTQLTEEQAKYLIFKATYSDGRSVSESDILDPGRKETVTITIEYKKEVTVDQAPKEDININLSLTIIYVQNDNFEYIPDIPDSPSIMAKDFLTGSSLSKTAVESISFSPTLKVDKNAIKHWDASQAKDNSVIAYYTDTDNNGKYELTICGNQQIIFPIDSSELFDGFQNLKSINFGGAVDTSKVTNMSYMFKNCYNLSKIEWGLFDTSNVTNMQGMFYIKENYTNSITTLNLYSFDTSNVTDMSYMFHGRNKLEKLDITSFNTTKVTNMSHMFFSCFSLVNIDLKSFDTSNVTDMNHMFYSCWDLTNLDLNGFNTSNVTNMNNMFYKCESLASIDLSSFNTSKVVDMGNMFDNCSMLTNINLNSFNTSKVTNMSYMFKNCYRLSKREFGSFDTSNVTSMQGMFYISSSYINSIEKLDLRLFDTSKVTDMSYMFFGRNKLKEINISNFKTSSLVNTTSMFEKCSGLTLLDMRNATFNKVSSYNRMFYDVPTSNSVTVYVKDQAAKDFVIDKRHFYNIQIVG